MQTTYDSSGYDDALGRRDGGSSAAWRPLKLFFVMSWCGHGDDYVPWLQADGLWLLVPMLGEAR